MHRLLSLSVFFLCAASIVACTKVESASKSIDETVTPKAQVTPTVSAKLTEPAHVAAECPTLPASYKTESRLSLKYTAIETFDGGVSYTLDGNMIIADGKVHRSPGNTNAENYVATCRQGVLKVEMSQPGEPSEDAKELTMVVKSVVTFKKFNEEGDFVIQTVEGGKSKFELMVSGVPSIKLPAHAASECPQINGTYTEAGSEVLVETVALSKGSSYRIGSMELIADGTQHSAKGSHESYIAICGKGQLRVFGFEGEISKGTIVVAPQDNGEIRTSRSADNRVENSLLEPVPATPGLTRNVAP